MIKTLAKSIRENKLPSILTLVFIMGEVLIEAFIPRITAGLVNNIETGAAMSEVLKSGLLLIALALVSLGCGSIAALTCAKASAGFARNLRHDMFERIQRFSFSNIDKFSSTSLVTRLTTDVTHVQMSYMMIIRTAIRSPMLLIFSVVMAYTMGGALATSFVVVIPVLICGLWFVSQKAMPAFKRVFKKYDKLNESIEENVRGMRVVKGFSRENYEKQKFANAADGITDDFTKAERIVALNTPIMQFCMYFNTVVILLLGSYLVISSSGAKVNMGHISAMLTYGVQILMSLMMLSMIYVMITISLESMKRICEVLKEEPNLKNPENPVFEVKNGAIQFNNVNFKYNENAKKFALENINVSIKPGMTVGIIGGTGSSKTSLVQLIPRLYDTTEGAVLVGGVDVRDYDIKTLRDNVAMVLQKNELFSGTIKENLRWGNEDATDEEIIAACKLAQADEFVTTFADGYDTYIEQGGTNVSGGQKQRLCIARALLKKPKILILDDSTSAVDTKTDALIRKGFKEFIPETTKIIIAQRIASVEDADLIIVLDNGKIDSMGEHDELLTTSNIYREVYEQQTSGGDSDEQ
ncbi:MAG: ABC transporter ATP-binding protein [Clostridia bacterium]|nr:ABC transporter ATP-binding protein [Clostridia bacterium]